MTSFSSQVSRGSDAHCLLGEALTAIITSSMLTILKLSSFGALPLVYCGDGATTSQPLHQRHSCRCSSDDPPEKGRLSSRFSFAK